MKKIIFLLFSILLFTSCSEKTPEPQPLIEMSDSLQTVETQMDTVVVTPKVIQTDTISVLKEHKIKCKTVTYRVVINNDDCCNRAVCYIIFDDGSRGEIPTGYWELIQKGDIICE